MHLGKNEVFLTDHLQVEVAHTQPDAPGELMQPEVLLFADHEVHLDECRLVDRIKAALIHHRYSRSLWRHIVA